MNIRNSEPGKQIVQTDLWAIKNNSLLKYFEIKLQDEVHLAGGGGMFRCCKNTSGDIQEGDIRRILELKNLLVSGNLQPYFAGGK